MSKVAIESEYKGRIIDSVIDTYLQVSGAICIEGPKWCGKTWTSSHHSNSEFLVGDPNNNFSNRQLADMTYSRLRSQRKRGFTLCVKAAQESLLFLMERTK